MGVTSHTRETLWQSHQVSWLIVWSLPHKIKTHKKLRKEKKATYRPSSSSPTSTSRVRLCVRIHWNSPHDMAWRLASCMIEGTPGAVCMGFLLDSLTFELKTQVSCAMERKEPFLGRADAVCGTTSTVKCWQQFTWKHSELSLWMIIFQIAVSKWYTFIYKL